MDMTEKQMMEDIKKAKETLSRKRKNLRNKRAKDKRAVLRKQTEDLGKELAELFGYKTRVLTEKERQEIIDQIKLGKKLTEQFPKVDISTEEKQQNFVREIIKRWRYVEKMLRESEARKHDESK